MAWVSLPGFGLVTLARAGAAFDDPCEADAAPEGVCGAPGVHCPGPDMIITDAVMLGDVVVVPAIGDLVIPYGGSPGMPVVYVGQPDTAVTGFVAIDVDDVLITDLVVQAPRFAEGCLLIGGDRVEVVRMRCTGSVGGITAADVTDLRVVRSEVSLNPQLVELTDVVRATFGCNRLVGAQSDGVTLDRCEDVLFERNFIADQQGWGLRATDGRDIRLFGNVIRGQVGGAYGDEDSRGWQVVGNTITAEALQSPGLDLDGGSDHALFGNVFASESGVALDLEEGGVSGYNLVAGRLAVPGNDPTSVVLEGQDWPLVGGGADLVSSYYLKADSVGQELVPATFQGLAVPQWDLLAAPRPCGERAEAGALEACAGGTGSIDTGGEAPPPVTVDGPDVWQLVSLEGGCAHAAGGSTWTVAVVLGALRRRTTGRAT
jgi:Right handed beta helix region